MARTLLAVGTVVLFALIITLLGPVILRRRIAANQKRNKATVT